MCTFSFTIKTADIAIYCSILYYFSITTPSSLLDIQQGACHQTLLQTNNTNSSCDHGKNNSQVYIRNAILDRFLLFDTVIQRFYGIRNA